MVARSQPRWQTPDWKRDLAQAFTRPAELLDHLGLAPSLAAGSDGAARQFPLLVPRGFADLMEPGNADDPLLRQVLPLARETAVATGYVADPVADTAASIAPGLLQKYAHRALLITTGACAVHCRYCFRRHFPYGAEARRGGPGAAVAALAARPDIDEAILSGGDPLMLDDSALADLVGALGDIPHLKRLRLHTRLPVVLPSRVTTALCALLADCRLETIVVVHANHPAELGDAAAAALRSLGERRLPLLNQSVLLRGVNDCIHVMKALVHGLLKIRVRPYYLYQCDLVHGAGHFRTPVAVGIEIIEALRGHTSGFAVPTFVVDAPGGGGKVPLMPNYLLSQSADRVVVRNFEGLITAYAQPDTYERHDPSRCASCRARAGAGVEDEQEGVAALLSGQERAIVPEGYAASHQRLTRIRWAPIKAALAGQDDER